MIDAVALGELLIDFTPVKVADSEKLHFVLNPGGAPGNVMVAMQKLGAQTAFIGKVGKDNFGEVLRDTLMREGVNVEGLAVDETVPTTLAFVTLDDEGDRSFTFYRSPGADIMLTSSDVPVSMLEQVSILHFGSISLTHSPSKEATMFAVEKAKELGKVISYDPNYRPPLWNGEQEAVEQMKWGLSQADIVKVSEEEMELLTGIADIEKGSRELVSLGACIVLVSAGEKGAYYATADFTGHVPAYKVNTIDTNGAGDTFFAAMLYQLKGKNRAELEKISKEEWEAYIDFANAAGAITTTRSGAIPALPTLAEVEECMQTKNRRC